MSITDEHEQAREGTAPRRAVLVGGAAGLLAAGVVLGAVLAGGGDSAPPAAAPAPTETITAPSSGAPAVPVPAPSTAPPAASGTAYGTSIPVGRPDQAPAVVARLRAQLGAIPVARVFSPGLPPARWEDEPVLAALGGDSSVVYSFQGDLDELAAGTHDALISGFLDSRPEGVQVWMVLKHEPEDDVQRGEFTAEQFRAATEHVAGVVREAGGIPTTVLQAYTLNPASGRDWRDFYTPAVDVLAWDAYNTAAKNEVPSYKAPEKFLEPVLAVAEETGKPFGFAEFGSPCLPNDPGCTGRAQWLTQMSEALEAGGAQFVTYWNRRALNGGVDYTLDGPSGEVWRGLSTS